MEINMQKYLEAGKIVNTHGVRGDLKLESYCDSPEALTKIKTLYIKNGEVYKEIKCKKSQVFKGMVLLHIDGCDTYEDAVIYKNLTVYADRNDVFCEKGKYFVADLIGLLVVDNETGECYGNVSDVVNYGAGDLYEIKKPDGKTVLVPAIEQFIPRIDLEKAVYITPIGGLLE